VVARRPRGGECNYAEGWRSRVGITVAESAVVDLGPHCRLQLASLGARFVPALLPADLWQGASPKMFDALHFFGVGSAATDGLQSSLVMLAVLALSIATAGIVIRLRAAKADRGAASREADQRLRMALTRAEAAVEMRDRLVANVSHELRTPLNVIIGYTDMLLESTEDVAAMVAHVAPRIRDYAVSLESIVSELLNISRLTCGNVKLAVTDIDVPALLDEVARGARALIGDRPVEVVIDCDVTEFRSDRTRVRQILNNLVANATKFTTEGRIVVTARAQRDAVGFYVSDTGCGIPAGKHEKIFCAFEQVTPGAHGGVGLGLAIVHQMTELLGGSISLTSAPGVGSSFAVTLPSLPGTRARDTDSAMRVRRPLVLSKSRAGERTASVAGAPVANVQPLVGCVDIERQTKAAATSVRAAARG
jgi:signal transduction histidine kinase